METSREEAAIAHEGRLRAVMGLCATGVAVKWCGERAAMFPQTVLF